MVANLERRAVLENTVKLAVVAPLLDLSELFLPPFYVSTEDSVEIEATDESITVRGRIDILVLKEQLWVLVIESKRAEFSPKWAFRRCCLICWQLPREIYPCMG